MQISKYYLRFSDQPVLRIQLLSAMQKTKTELVSYNCRDLRLEKSNTEKPFKSPKVTKESTEQVS